MTAWDEPGADPVGDVARLAAATYRPPPLVISRVVLAEVMHLDNPAARAELDAIARRQGFDGIVIV